jgi:hypothetical protein
MPGRLACPHPREFGDMWVAVIALSVLVGTGSATPWRPKRHLHRRVPLLQLGRDVWQRIYHRQHSWQDCRHTLLVPLTGFLLGTYGLWTGQSWWRLLLALAWVASIVVVLRSWRVMPTFSYVGALTRLRAR